MAARISNKTLNCPHPEVAVVENAAIRLMLYPENVQGHNGTNCASGRHPNMSVDEAHVPPAFT